jgi:hypothetical protein
MAATPRFGFARGAVEVSARLAGAAIFADEAFV